MQHDKISRISSFDDKEPLSGELPSGQILESEANSRIASNTKIATDVSDGSRLNVRRSSTNTIDASEHRKNHASNAQLTAKEVTKHRQLSNFYHNVVEIEALNPKKNVNYTDADNLEAVNTDHVYTSIDKTEPVSSGIMPMVSKPPKDTAEIEPLSQNDNSDSTLSHEQRTKRRVRSSRLGHQKPDRLKHRNDKVSHPTKINDKAEKQFYNPNKIKPSVDVTTSTSSQGGVASNRKPLYSSARSDISLSQSKADKKAVQARSNANYSAIQLEKAQSQLPKKHRLKLDKTIEPNSKNLKPKQKLRFEAEVKDQASHMKGNALTRPMKMGTNAAIAYGHKKIYSVERENVGTEAAHKGELLVEGGIRKAYRHSKTKRYRKVSRLEGKTSKLNAKASFRKTVADNPRLQKNLTSRMIQKRQIKRQYANVAKGTKKSGATIKKSAQMIGKAANALIKAVVKNPKVLLILGAIFLLFVIISSAFVSCSSTMSGLGEVVTATSYLAEDAHIDDAAIAYTEWETELEMRLQNIQTEFPDFDEYHISGASIGHNPFELMAYLTALYHDFTYPEIRAILREIFDERYQLIIMPSVEIRYYLNEDDESVPYEWNVLTVTLISRSFSEVINARMNDEQRQHFDLLMHSRGNRQYVGSPFPFDWIPFISSGYGWRIHPINGNAEFHTGVDIALPGGTQILAALGGIVTFAGDNGGYGNFIIIDHGNGLITRYAHCDTILVSVGQEVLTGDVIATVGTTGVSTGNHLHFEVIKDDRFLNPIFFALTGEGVHSPSFDFPSIPLDDESFAALIAEAERHLGIPYVWGGSTPSQGFDCSGFVSYVLRMASIRDVGRLTAQGLFNISAPVSTGDVRPGDLVFFHSTFSSYRTVTHVGIYVGNGYMIHTGSNPAGVEYTNINTSFWQRHFFGFGRI